MARTTPIATTLALALASTFVTATGAGAAPPAKVQVCHWTPGAAGAVVIEVAEPAVQAHLARNEANGVVGVDVDENCDPIVDELDVVVLARATTASSGGGSALLAQLEDTNGDGVPSAGDTVVTDSYPMAFDGSVLGSFTVTAHVVDAVEAVTASTVRVASGTSHFEWTAEDARGSEVWQEQGPSGRTILMDGRTEMQRFDIAFISPGSPSAPAASHVMGVLSSSDDGFVDVELLLP